ncbi:lipid A biosynthesis acyltransferase [Niabella ginsenosidivorans]|uniref:Lipid A biosynthesis acyltransferase n=2 Tax=Niabella ginsenosidivorans TaxID=1176587 RepID=A0A1A9IBX9_9BACT|nr:lipid A biosynthesis acyltransferase [Niabella ginsenosidivorans]
MSDWDGSSKANTTGYRIFIMLLKMGGTGPAYLLLRFVAFYYFLFSARANRAIRYYLRQRLHFSGLKAIRLRYCNYYWFGQALIDRIVLMAGIKNKFTFNFDGEAYLKEMVAGGKGGLLLSAHIGNWEIAGHLLKRLNTKIHIVMYDGEQQQIKEYLNSVTGERNAHIIIIKDAISHIYEIMEALNNNELVCMHSDRFLPGNKTLSADFLGAPAAFPAGPFTIAAKLAVPVSFVFALKESATHYHFFATPGAIYKDRPQKDNPEAILADFIEQVTLKVQQYPDQWYNYYPFWEKDKRINPS